MARDNVQLQKKDSILDEVVRLEDDIRRRAYDFFCNHEGLHSGPLEDWYRAEQELVWSPAIQLRQKDDEFELEASIAGVEPSDLDVQVTPEDVLIKGRTIHEHDTYDGTVHLCEFKSGQLFRSVHLPARIDPDSVKAEHRHGVLRLTARIAKAAPKEIDVQAA